LWHIHELEYVLRLTTIGREIEQLFPLATRFVAVSDSVRKTLVQKFAVRANAVDLVHGFVPSPNLLVSQRESRRSEIRRSLNWPADAFVVGACGDLGWRKGTDVFLRIANEMLKPDEDDRIRFLWVGGRASSDEALRFEHDVRSFGLEERCRHIPTTAEVLDYYYAMDVFALTSREDPFPLVMLEAGTCSLPIVCFAGSGGGPEFVGDDAGLTASYLDTRTFIDCLHKLRESPELRAKLGMAAAEKVRRNHAIETQAPKLLASMHHCLLSSSRSNRRLNLECRAGAPLQ
jgi:glycosyltransferase involved in cell wall biosynthesis